MIMRHGLLWATMSTEQMQNANLASSYVQCTSSVCDVALTELKPGSWQASQCVTQEGGVHWLVGVLTLFLVAKLSKQIPQS